MQEPQKPSSNLTRTTNTNSSPSTSTVPQFVQTRSCTCTRSTNAMPTPNSSHTPNWRHWNPLWGPPSNTYSLKSLQLHMGKLRRGTVCHTTWHHLNQSRSLETQLLLGPLQQCGQKLCEWTLEIIPSLWIGLSPRNSGTKGNHRAPHSTFPETKQEI